MIAKEWWLLLGLICLCLVICYVVYIYYIDPNAQKQTLRQSQSLSFTGIPHIPNSVDNAFAQEWQTKYLATNSAECLQYLPTFHGEFWNNTPASKFNNCYAYAFRNMDLNRNHKPQPGELSKKPQVPKDNYTCDRIFENVVSDHPRTFKWDVHTPCPCGYFKGFLVLSKNPTDYHFLREDSNGFWSHKLGGGSATQYDASGQLITDPYKANLHFGEYHYDNRCFAFCTPYEKQDSQW